MVLFGIKKEVLNILDYMFRKGGIVSQSGTMVLATVVTPTVTDAEMYSILLKLPYISYFMFQREIFGGTEKLQIYMEFSQEVELEKRLLNPGGSADPLRLFTTVILRPGSLKSTLDMCSDSFKRVDGAEVHTYGKYKKEAVKDVDVTEFVVGIKKRYPEISKENLTKQILRGDMGAWYKVYEKVIDNGINDGYYYVYDACGTPKHDKFIKTLSGTLGAKVFNHTDAKKCMKEYNGEKLVVFNLIGKKKLVDYALFDAIKNGSVNGVTNKKPDLSVKVVVLSDHIPDFTKFPIGRAYLLVLSDHYEPDKYPTLFYLAEKNPDRRKYPKGVVEVVKYIINKIIHGSSK